MIVSGPVTDTLVQLAVSGTEAANFFENYSFDDPNAAINGAEKYYGDESTQYSIDSGLKTHR